LGFVLAEHWPSSVISLLWLTHFWPPAAGEEEKFDLAVLFALTKRAAAGADAPGDSP
jgi:hypothetical protein